MSNSAFKSTRRAARQAHNLLARSRQFLPQFLPLHLLLRVLTKTAQSHKALRSCRSARRERIWAVEEPKGVRSVRMRSMYLHQQDLEPRFVAPNIREANHPETEFWRGCQRASTPVYVGGLLLCC